MPLTSTVPYSSMTRHCLPSISFVLTRSVRSGLTLMTTSRKYMLTMETMGYLDAASRTSLMQDLSDLQVTDIDLTGSTMTDAGYGNAVYLQITCKLPIEQLNMDGNDMLRFFFEDGTIPIRVRRMSTAKN